MTEIKFEASKRFEIIYAAGLAIAFMESGLTAKEFIKKNKLK